MTRTIICPKCGAEIPPSQEKFTTMRVSKEFASRVRDEQIDATLEDTLRRLLGWEEEGKE